MIGGPNTNRMKADTRKGKSTTHKDQRTYFVRLWMIVLAWVFCPFVVCLDSARDWEPVAATDGYPAARGPACGAFVASTKPECCAWLSVAAL